MLRGLGEEPQLVKPWPYPVDDVICPNTGFLEDSDGEETPFLGRWQAVEPGAAQIAEPSPASRGHQAPFVDRAAVGTSEASVTFSRAVGWDVVLSDQSRLVRLGSAPCLIFAGAESALHDLGGDPFPMVPIHPFSDPGTSFCNPVEYHPGMLPGSEEIAACRCALHGFGTAGAAAAAASTAAVAAVAELA